MSYASLFPLTRWIITTMTLILVPVLTAVEPQAGSSHGLTPLMESVRHGRLDRVRALLAAGAEVNRQDDFGMSALMWASAIGKPEFVEVLLDAGARINAANTSGFTALIQSIDLGREEVAELLLEKGADPNAVESNGLSVLKHAVNKDNVTIIENLLKAGLDVNARENIGILVLPAYRDQAEIVRLLLAAGANIDERDPDDPYQANSLMRASMAGNVDIVRMLLEAGADLYVEDMDGDKAFKYADLGGDMEVVRILKLAKTAGKNRDR